VLERNHGRKPLHGSQMERVRRGLSRRRSNNIYGTLAGAVVTF
jgi:hypothetical protein